MSSSAHAVLCVWVDSAMLGGALEGQAMEGVAMEGVAIEGVMGGSIDCSVIGSQEGMTGGTVLGL